MFYPIEIKLHDGTGPWATSVDKLIRTVSKKTHAESKLPDHLPEKYRHLEGMSFSSTSRQDLGVQPGQKNGVRFKAIGYSHPERWQTYTLWVTAEELERIINRMILFVSLKIEYDFRGAAGCAVTGRQDPWKHFCSESLFDAIFIEWLPATMNYKMHPDKLEEVAIVVEARLLERKFTT